MPPAIPATAIFYSTIRNWGWGAPDYVWPVAAAELLRRGIGVVAFVRPQLQVDERIRRLAAAGARILPQPPLHLAQGRIAQARGMLARWSAANRQLRHVLQHSLRPHVFIDQGGALDFLDEPILLRHLGDGNTHYDVFFRSNNYAPPLSDPRRARASAFLTSADRCLFNSQWTRELTELQLLTRLPNARLFTHLVRFDHVEPLAWPAGGTARLATVSRLDVHHKGMDVLLQGLCLLRDEPRPWTLDIYGQGPDEGYLRELISWLGLQERVRIHPHAEDVRTIWQRCHLLVLMSRYEGLAVAMLEAMACGRPVLRTPYGGCAEWIVPGETGYVCPAAEPPLIAASLREALAGFDRWPALGRAAHVRVRAELPAHPESAYLEPFDANPAAPGP